LELLYMQQRHVFAKTGPSFHASFLPLMLLATFHTFYGLHPHTGLGHTIRFLELAM
jgi:hypothetical protein